MQRAAPLVGAAVLGATGLLATQHLFSTPPVATNSALPKLTYFDGHGRAFVARAALRRANVGYTDERLSFPELEKRRGASGANDQVPLGQLPVLTLPGTGLTHCQSSAIARWAGKKAGLYPKDDDLALIVDDVTESLEELFSKLPRESDPEVNKTKRLEYAANVVPKYMNHLTAQVQRSGGPFVLGKAPSIADYTVFRVVNAVKTGQIDHLEKSALDKYAAAVKIYEAVAALPEVKAELAHQEARTKAAAAAKAS